MAKVEDAMSGECACGVCVESAWRVRGVCVECAYECACECAYECAYEWAWCVWSLCGWVVCWVGWGLVGWRLVGVVGLWGWGCVVVGFGCGVG